MTENNWNVMSCAELINLNVLVMGLGWDIQDIQGQAGQVGATGRGFVLLGDCRMSDMWTDGILSACYWDFAKRLCPLVPCFWNILTD